VTFTATSASPVSRICFVHSQSTARPTATSAAGSSRRSTTSSLSPAARVRIRTAPHTSASEKNTTPAVAPHCHTVSPAIEVCAQAGRLLISFSGTSHPPSWT
jgi:hypothetical protein